MFKLPKANEKVKEKLMRNNILKKICFAKKGKTENIDKKGDLWYT